MVAEWLVAGGKFTPPREGIGRWYDMETYWKRVAGSWVWWLFAFLVLAVLGTISAKGSWDLLVESGHKTPDWLKSLWVWMTSEPGHKISHWLTSLWSWLASSVAF